MIPHIPFPSLLPRFVLPAQGISRLRPFLKSGLIAVLILLAHIRSDARPYDRPLYRDSLWNAYHHYQGPDTAKLYLLAKLANTYLNDSIDKAYYYAQGIAAQSVRIGWMPGIVRSMSLTAGCFFSTEAWNDALAYYRCAQRLSHSIGRKDMEVVALYNISKVYDFQQIRDSCLKYKKAALRLAGYIPNADFKANLLSEAASNFAENGRPDTAIVLWKESIRTLTGHSKRVCDLGLFWNNLSSGYNDVGKFDSSLYCIEQGMKAAMVEKDSTILAILTEAMGDYYLQTGRPRQAIPYMVEAVNLSPFKGGNNYMKVLSETYGKIGLYDSALFYYEQYNKYHDEFVGLSQKAEVSRQLMKMTMNQQLHSFQKEVKQKDQEGVANRQKMAVVSLAALLLVVLTILLAWSNQRNKHKTRTISLMTEELTHKNKEIQTSLTEKETLLKEIHHRVKNNLQVVSSLLDLQLSGISEPLVQQAVQISKSRISAISLIHKQLYQHEHLTDVDMRSYSNKLFEQLHRIYSRDKPNIVFHNNVGRILFNADVATTLSLILNELLTNSFKYAFDQVPDPRITLDLHQLTGNTYLLEYSDNGPGLAEGFDYRSTKTLGMQLIMNLSIQLGGHFDYDRAGKKYLITFVY